MNLEEVQGWGDLSPAQKAKARKFLALHWEDFEGEELISFSSRRDLIEIKSRDNIGKYNRFITEIN
jgi:hypothetical protein